jgi:hypothetical protein
MITNIEKVYEDAMQLPNESKAQLAERIVNFLETHIDPQIENVHLDIVEQRKNEIKNGLAKGVDAHDVSFMARRVINL